MKFEDFALMKYERTLKRSTCSSVLVVTGYPGELVTNSTCFMNNL